MAVQCECLWDRRDKPEGANCGVGGGAIVIGPYIRDCPGSHQTREGGRGEGKGRGGQGDAQIRWEWEGGSEGGGEQARTRGMAMRTGTRRFHKAKVISIQCILIQERTNITKKVQCFSKYTE